MLNCNTDNMNTFLNKQTIYLKTTTKIFGFQSVMEQKDKGLKKSENIIIDHIPSYTPEMNPIEQIWKQIRQMGF